MTERNEPEGWDLVISLVVLAGFVALWAVGGVLWVAQVLNV